MKRGFAALSPEARSEIASRGGKAAQASGKAHRYTSETATIAGRKGGHTVASRPGYMAEIGRRGGLIAASRPGHMAEIGRKGGAVGKTDGDVES